MRRSQPGKPATTTLIRTILDHKSGSTALGSLCTDTEIDWLDFMRLAGDTLISGSLWPILESLGLSQELPLDVQNALQAVNSANRSRNLHISKAVKDLGLLLNSVGISPIPIKGVALLLDGIYPDSSYRIMGDVDLLIDPKHIPAALSVLAENDYVQVGNCFTKRTYDAEPEYAPIDCSDFRNDPCRSFHHLPPIKSGQDDFVNVELHTSVTQSDHGQGSGLNSLVWSHLKPRVFNGVKYCLPSTEFTLIHTLHHALIVNRTLSLGQTDYRHLLDADFLLKDIVEKDRLPQLLSLVRALGFEDEFTFFLWQSEDILGTNRLPEWTHDSGGLALINEFQYFKNSHRSRIIRQLFLAVKMRLNRIIGASFYREAYGPLPLYRSVPMYIRYLLAKYFIYAK